MPLPIAPVAGIAIRYGAVAIATYAITRRIERGHFDQRGEDAMNDVNEGVTLRSDKGQVSGTGRFRRVIRLGRTGPGVEIDATALSRIRIRRL